LVFLPASPAWIVVGRRRAASDEAIAAYDDAVANYRQTVLTGFQQVEDGLAAVAILEQEAKVQARAVAAAQKSLDLSTIRYKGGVTSYLEVITAQSAALSNEVTAVNILGRRLASTVLLIQALGGSWKQLQPAATSPVLRETGEQLRRKLAKIS